MLTAAPEAKDQSFAFVLVSMLAGQALGTIATMTLPALAPAASASLGISSALIGYQISILAGAMLVSLLLGGNLSVRWGACRVTQIGLSLCAAGCLIATGPHAAFFFTSAIALGLGYGLLSPAASHLLMRYTPAHRRNVLFSLKQTGVPIGGIGASLIAPAVATLFGWRWALVVSAAMLAVLIVVLQTRRARWDDDRTSDTPVIANPLEGITTIWRQRTLRNLAIAGAFLVIPQIGLTTFTVVLFVEEAGYSLITAGFVLTASQVGGVAGRVFWGWMADLTRSCYSALAILCGVMIAAALACFLITPAWPLPLACLLFFVFGSTASGWNGAFMAEVARLVPSKLVSRTTAGALFYVNIGKMVGPLVVANAYAWSGRYAIAFGCLSVVTAAALGCLLTARGLPSTLAAQHHNRNEMRGRRT
jgi:MFS family permease